MDPPTQQFDAVVIYINENDETLYCDFITLSALVLPNIIFKENFQRIEKIGNEYLIFKRIKRRKLL